MGTEFRFKKRDLAQFTDCNRWVKIAYDKDKYSPSTFSKLSDSNRTFTKDKLKKFGKIVGDKKL